MCISVYAYIYIYTYKYIYMYIYVYARGCTSDFCCKLYTHVLRHICVMYTCVKYGDVLYVYTCDPLYTPMHRVLSLCKGVIVCMYAHIPGLSISWNLHVHTHAHTCRVPRLFTYIFQEEKQRLDTIVQEYENHSYAPFLTHMRHDSFTCVMTPEICVYVHTHAGCRPFE